jgi:hypothetical protein
MEDYIKSRDYRNKIYKKRTGLSESPLYLIWAGIMSKTRDPKHESYAYYGGLGIRVCDRWLDIENFIEDMYPSYIKGLALDRIDNDKWYCLENCRWVDKSTHGRSARAIISTNSSKCIGVSWNKIKKVWVSKIKISNKYILLGVFDTEEEAIIAYNKYVSDNNIENIINNMQPIKEDK